MSEKMEYAALAQYAQELKSQNDFLRQCYAAMVDNSIDAILLTTPDGKIIFANPAACQLFLMTEQELIDGGRSRVVDTSDSRLAHALEERERTGRFKGELNFRKKDGTLFPAEISSVVFEDAKGRMMTSMVIRDVSERKRLIREIQQTGLLLERVYSSLDVAVFVVDPRTRCIISCNDAATKIFGYPSSRMLGQNTEFLHVSRKTYREFGRKLSAAMADEDMFQMEFSLRKKDGTIFPTEHTVKTVRDDVHQPVLHISVIRDITLEHQLTCDLLKQQKDSQAKADQLAELNAALNVLLEQRDQEKRHFETRLLESVDGLLFPYLDKIRKTGLTPLQKEYINILEASLKEIAMPYHQRLMGRLMHLTPTEIRIVNSIKQGYRIKEIALNLNVSPRTIEFHRDNIRKKLGIKGRKINLRSYLSSLS